MNWFNSISFYLHKVSKVLWRKWMSQGLRVLFEEHSAEYFLSRSSKWIEKKFKNIHASRGIFTAVKCLISILFSQLCIYVINNATIEKQYARINVRGYRFLCLKLKCTYTVSWGCIDKIYVVKQQKQEA